MNPWTQFVCVFVLGSLAAMAVQMHRSNWDNDDRWQR